MAAQQQNKNIHWYPGHMAKAMKELDKKIKFVDIIIELADARAPFSSRNPELVKRGENKKRLIILTKIDLADEVKLNRWVEYYKSHGATVLALDLHHHQTPQIVIDALLKLGEEKWEKDKKRGLKPQPIRALVTGIPNVGKSTLINKLAGKRSAKVANRPGLTRAQQYIKISSQLELIDTPGVLPPNYEDPKTALNLAMIGTIPATILPLLEIVDAILKIVKDEQLDKLNERYNINIEQTTPNHIVLAEISKARGFLNAELDNYQQAAETLHREFGAGLLGRYTLEEVSCD